MNNAAHLARLPDMAVRDVVTEAIGEPIRARNPSTAAPRLADVAHWFALATIR